MLSWAPCTCVNKQGFPDVSQVLRAGSSFCGRPPPAAPTPPQHPPGPLQPAARLTGSWENLNSLAQSSRRSASNLSPSAAEPCVGCGVPPRPHTQPHLCLPLWADAHACTYTGTLPQDPTVWGGWGSSLRVGDGRAEGQEAHLAPCRVLGTLLHRPQRNFACHTGKGQAQQNQGVLSILSPWLLQPPGHFSEAAPFPSRAFLSQEERGQGAEQDHAPRLRPAWRTQGHRPGPTCPDRLPLLLGPQPICGHIQLGALGVSQ